MSASEKLKALDAEWQDADDLLALRNALPQIVAVVEAAEAHAKLWKVWNYPAGDPRSQLPTALAALDEALQ